jgi:hypothetical protein
LLANDAGARCIEELRERIRRLEGAAGRRRLVLPFGLKAIDRHLPGGGLALGALHDEPVQGEPVSGEDSLLSGKRTGSFVKIGPFGKKPPVRT